MNKSSNTSGQGYGLLIGAASLIVAIAAWLSPFNPTRHSPLDPPTHISGGSGSGSINEHLSPPSGGSSTGSDHAVDVSGTWSGTLFQRQSTGATIPYAYAITLLQNGERIDGTASMALASPYNYSVRMQIQGSIAGKILSYTDGPIVQSSAPATLLWCQKAVKLTYDATNDTLKGTWSQNGYGSGQITLRKQ
jgi:hypothetical protein